MTPTPEAVAAATRAAVLEHVLAFNAHDTDRLCAGLAPDVVWATGSDVFLGAGHLRDELFDEGLWELRPSLEVRTLVVEGRSAAAVVHEELVVDGGGRQFDIAVFFAVREGLIRAVTVFREDSAVVEP